MLGVRLNQNGVNNYYYYHYDAQGDVSAVTDANGNLYRQYVYDPYGNIISEKDGSGNSINIANDTGFNNAYTYRGYRFDPESGLYFLQSRYYAAGIGRFLTKDAFKGAEKDPQKLNRYVYTGGDPVNNVDPTGSDSQSIESAVLTGVGMVAIGAAIVFAPEIIAAGAELFPGAASLIAALLGLDSQGAANAALTGAEDLAAYIRSNGQLPENFITKAEARSVGWDPSAGNLAEVAPGKSIGGDIFRNAEGLLPDAPGRVWYEADLNYSSGFRGGERLVYSNDGLTYLTTDHYQTFIPIQ